MSFGPALVLALVIGTLGYREAKSFETKYGHPAYSIAPIGWAVICGASLLVGGLLLWSARRSENKKQPVVAPAQPLQRVADE